MSTLLATESMEGIFAVRDAIRDRIAAIVEGDEKLQEPFREALLAITRDEWAAWNDLRFRLFHMMLEPVASRPVYLDRQAEADVSPPVDALVASSTMPAESGLLDGVVDTALAARLISAKGIAFFACNYFQPTKSMGMAEDEDPRLPAIRAVDAGSVEHVRDAYALFMAVRKRCRNDGFRPINDLISQLAKRRRVWAVQFVTEGRAEIHEADAEPIADRPLRRRPLILRVPLAAFDWAPAPPDITIAPINGPRENDLDALSAKFRPAPRNVDSQVAAVAAEYINWLFQPTESVSPLHAYAILACLLPFQRLTGVTCHYAFPAHFSVPRLSDDGVVRPDDSCSTLSLGSRCELASLERKVLSDLSARLLLTPLLQDYAIIHRKAISQVEFLARFLGPAVDVSKVLRQGNKAVSDWLVNVFADLSGFTKACKSVRATIGGDADKELLRFLQKLWAEVTKLVHAHKAAVGGYAGDGIYFYFSEKLIAEMGLRTSRGALACLALSCAIRLRLKLKEVIADEPSADLRAALADSEFHVGVSCGSAVRGNIIGDGGFYYTAVSDNVNVASRYCDLADRSSGELIVEREVIDEVNQHLDYHFQAIAGKYSGVFKVHDYGCKQSESGCNQPFAYTLNFVPSKIAQKHGLAAKQAEVRYGGALKPVFAFRTFEKADDSNGATLTLEELAQKLDPRPQMGRGEDAVTVQEVYQ